MTENQLRWFEHVQRRPLEALVRSADNIVLGFVKRGRGRPKRTLEDIIKSDLMVNKILFLTERNGVV